MAKKKSIKKTKRQAVGKSKNANTEFRQELSPEAKGIIRQQLIDIAKPKGRHSKTIKLSARKKVYHKQVKKPITFKDPHFTFKYEGTSQLDINTVISSLENVKRSLEQISWETNGTPIKIQIAPFQVGSFEWTVALIDPVVVTQASLIVNAIAGDTIIEKFKTMIKVLIFLNGKQPNEVTEISENKVEIKNDSGKVIAITGDTYKDMSNNSGYIINIEKFIINASKDEAITGFQLLDKNLKSLIKIPKENLRDTGINLDKRRNEITVETQKTNDVAKENVHVATTKPDLAGNTLWNVVYEGNTIKLKIEDEQFLTDVNKGKYAFANGTALNINMTIKQIFDEKLNVYLNKYYILTKFHSIVNPPQQSNLEFSE